MNSGSDTESLSVPSVSTMTAWFVGSGSRGQCRPQPRGRVLAGIGDSGDRLEADEAIAVGEAEREAIEHGLHGCCIPVFRLPRERAGERVGAEPRSVPIGILVKQARDVGHDPAAHRSRRRLG